VDIAALPSRHLGDILRNSVSLSHRGVVWRLLDTAVPASWARHSLLRSARPLALDPSGEVGVGRYRIRLDPELGLLINARDTESGGPEW
jgi:hypothetical protein